MLLTHPNRVVEKALVFRSAPLRVSEVPGFIHAGKDGLDEV